MAFSDPWSARDFGDCIAAGVPCFVAVAGGVVAGYVVAHWAADEGEILNLAVAPAHRGKGVGHALARHVLDALGRRRVRTVYLEVRESNAVARRLYESLRFQEVARRPRYYRRPVEDAIVLRVSLSGTGVGGEEGSAIL